MNNNSNSNECKEFSLLDFSEFTPPSYEEWKKEAEDSLKGKPIEKIYTKTYEDIELKPIYLQEDIENLTYLQNSIPGVSPFLRADSLLGYKEKSWNIAQELNYSNPKDFNSALKYSLSRGQNSICITNKSDNISQLNKGTEIFDLEDLEIALSDIDLAKFPININFGKDSLTAYSAIIAFCNKNNISINSLKGGLNYDPIAIAVQTGKLDKGIENSILEMNKLVDYSSNFSPDFRVIGINGDVYHNSGANAIQELAISLASAIEYLRQLSSMGLDINKIAQQIRFNFAVGSNFFMEIAKLRSARMLWAKIIESLDANQESAKMNIFTKVSGINKSKLDPNTNMLRNTIESLAAIIGGSNWIQTSPYDDMLNPANEFADRVARNTQVVLKEECNLNDVIDPAGGSWYIEYLTYTLAQKTWDLINNIENQGGVIKALENGFIQELISKTRSARIKNLSTRFDILLGTNKQANLNEEILENNNEKTVTHKKTTKTTCSIIKSNKNISNIDTKLFVSEIIQELSTGTAISAIDSAIFDNKNTWTIKSIPTIRLSEVFEEVRKKASIYKQKHNYLPKILLLNYGTVKDYKARNDFAGDFLRVGGFETISSNSFNNIEEAGRYIIESDYQIVVFCSTDILYQEFIPQLSRLIKKAKPLTNLVLAGYPLDMLEEYKSAGIDEFIHIKANICDVLNKLHDILSV